MKPYRTRICADCDNVHDRPQCPMCGSCTYTPFTRTVLYQPRVMQIILSDTIQRRMPDYLSIRAKHLAGAA